MVTIGGLNFKGAELPYYSVEMNHFNTDMDLNCSIANIPEGVYDTTAIMASVGIISCDWKICWRLTDNLKWTTFPSMNEYRTHFTLNQINNSLVAVGGDGSKGQYDSLEYIDFNTGKEWTTQTLMKKFRRKYHHYLDYVRLSGHCSITLDDRFILLIGGYNNRKVNKIS